MIELCRIRWNDSMSINTTHTCQTTSINKSTFNWRKKWWPSHGCIWLGWQLHFSAQWQVWSQVRLCHGSAPFSFFHYIFITLFDNTLLQVFHIMNIVSHVSITWFCANFLPKHIVVVLYLPPTLKIHLCWLKLQYNLLFSPPFRAMILVSYCFPFVFVFLCSSSWPTKMVKDHFHVYKNVSCLWYWDFLFH